VGHWASRGICDGTVLYVRRYCATYV